MRPLADEGPGAAGLVLRPARSRRHRRACRRGSRWSRGSRRARRRSRRSDRSAPGGCKMVRDHGPHPLARLVDVVVADVDPVDRGEAAEDPVLEALAAAVAPRRHVARACGAGSRRGSCRGRKQARRRVRSVLPGSSRSGTCPARGRASRSPRARACRPRPGRDTRSRDLICPGSPSRSTARRWCFRAPMPRVSHEPSPESPPCMAATNALAGGVRAGNGCQASGMPVPAVIRAVARAAPLRCITAGSSPGAHVGRRRASWSVLRRARSSRIDGGCVAVEVTRSARSQSS